jgi:hypothetical protein
LLCSIPIPLTSATDPIFRFNTKNPDAVISIVDESLEMNKDIRCDLFAGVSATELSLALLDKKQNKFLALEIFQNDGIAESSNHEGWLKEIPGKSNLLKNFKFKSTTVAVVNETTTLVPSALFREEDAAKYFRFNFEKNDSPVFSEQVRAFDVVNVFGLPVSAHVSLNGLFSNPSIHHHTTALLEGVRLSIKPQQEKTLVLNIRTGYVDILVMEGKKLVLINSFSYKNMDDLVYYVMFACDRLQLNPETVSTFIAGEVQKESAVYHLLYKYIRNIKFLSRPAPFDFSYVFNEIPAHFYFNLFSLALCES